MASRGVAEAVFDRVEHVGVLVRLAVELVADAVQREVRVFGANEHEVLEHFVELGNLDRLARLLAQERPSVQVSSHVSKVGSSHCKSKSW